MTEGPLIGANPLGDDDCDIAENGDVCCCCCIIPILIVFGILSGFVYLIL